MDGADLIARARAGDSDAFGQLVGPYRRELQVHCYRMLGSLADAEDQLQETLLAAWLGLGGFQGRASVRTWLYRIATNRCVDALRSASRRPQVVSGPPPGVELPEPTRLGEVVWLEPCPDALLDGVLDCAPGPEARYQAKEAISVAFMTALQLLPPRQRAVLILRDVLGFHATEAAEILQSSQESVTSALKRARAALRRLLPASAREEPPREGSAAEQAIADRLTRAYEAGDVDGVVALLAKDVLLNMPQAPLQYQGRDLADRFLRTVAFRGGRTFRLIPARANGQPAFGVYLRDDLTGVAHVTGLLVLTLAGDRISALTRFDNSSLIRFGLPPTVPARSALTVP